MHVYVKAKNGESFDSIFLVTTVQKSAYFTLETNGSIICTELQRTAVWEAQSE